MTAGYTRFLSHADAFFRRSGGRRDNGRDLRGRRRPSPGAHVRSHHCDQHVLLLHRFCFKKVSNLKVPFTNCKNQSFKIRLLH